MPRTISDDIFDSPVQGLNLGALPATLGGQLAGGPVLLTFLRHFGCPFCKQTVDELKTLTARTPAYPHVLFVTQCTLDETAAFFKDRWPEARAIADPEKKLYEAMGLRRGTVGQVFGIRVWGCAIRAMTKGHFSTKPVGDPWLMPGAFLVLGGEVLWQHEFRHQGDLPDWGAIVNQIPCETRP